MGSTVIGSVTYPENTDQPVTPADMRVAFEQTARLALPRFSNQAELTAALATLQITATEGQAAVLQDVDQVVVWNGSSWVPVIAYGNPTTWNMGSAWTASAGAPAINDGTLTGEYQQIGKWVDAKLDLVGGPSSTYGTAGAYWKFQIPVGTVSGLWSGGCFAVDTGALEYPLHWVIGYDANNILVLFKPGSGRAFNTNPFTFGNGDKLSVNFRYRMA